MGKSLLWPFVMTLDLEGQHVDVLPLVGVGWSICLAIVNLNVVFASVMTCGSTAAFSLSIQSASGSLNELDGTKWDS